MCVEHEKSVLHSWDGGMKYFFSLMRRVSPCPHLPKRKCLNIIASHGIYATGWKKVHTLQERRYVLVVKT